jgi:thiamine-phosphate pyrophosphorylase
MTFSIPRLYAIIDPVRLSTLSPFEVTKILLQAGVRLIQYRDKQASSRQLFETSAQMADRVRAAGGTFIVNDRADVALLAGADGVHLGQEDLPVEWARRVLEMHDSPGRQRPRLVGCSTHNLAQVKESDRTSADYIAFGPIFETRSKANAETVVGLDGLKEARKATRKPLVAIGGITLESAIAVIEAGADSVATIGDLMKGGDPGTRAREYLDLLAGC